MTKNVSKEQRQFTIWDNFELHKKELLELQATDEEIEELRLAAEAVANATDSALAEKPDLASITEPRSCANGWVIQPPTKQARFYARLAALEATGGRGPSSDLGAAMAVMAGLWALRLIGDGKIKTVLAALAVVGGVAEVVSDLSGEDQQSIDRLAEDYMLLMGFRVPPALEATAALEKYLQRRLEIIDRLVARSRTGS